MSPVGPQKQSPMDQSILAYAYAYVNTNSVEWKEAVPVGLQNGNRVNLSGCFND